MTHAGQPPRLRSRSARGLRWRSALAAAGLVTIVAGAGAALVTLADSSGARLDLTAAGEQRLSPRTLALLESAADKAPGARLIIVGPVSGVDARTRREVGDVLELFESHPSMGVSVLDTATADGAARYGQLLDDLTAEHAEALAAFSASLDEQFTDASALALWLSESMSPRLQSLGRAAPELEADAQRVAAAARIAARDLTAAIDRWPGSPSGPIELASADDARVATAELLARAAGILEAGAALAAQSDTRLSTAFAGQRDAAASIGDSLATLQPPTVVRAARALERGEGVMLLAPGAVAALAFDDVYAASMKARADVRRTAEDAIASGLAAMLDPHRPIVVLLHAELGPILDRFRGFDGVIGRLASRGIDVAEWPAGTQDAPPPNLRPIDPAGLRPVVYVTLAPDSAARARGDDPASSGPARAKALATTMVELIDRGESLLVSLNPSVLPGVGGEDPVARTLRPLGIEALTVAPLLGESFGPEGRSAQIDLAATAAVVDHPIAAAVRGLPTALPWVIPVRTEHAALFRFEGDSYWTEREWVRIWTTPHAQRGVLLQQTRYDEERDGRDGPWTVATATERPVNGVSQRVVVVGSNGWFADGLALASGELEGRRITLYPGNLELLESSVLWLSGRDDEVMPGAEARAVPLVKALDASAFRWMRWSLVLGLPAGVLAVGGVWRLARG